MQPQRGYRAAIDPVLLAAAVPAGSRGRALDLGCGAGAATLCLAWRLPELAVVGLERDAGSAALARANVAENRLDERIRIVTGDVRSPPRALEPESFATVIVNPPYLDAARADAAPDAAKAAATVESDADLAAWVGAALRLAQRKGEIVFIHRADRVAEILAALTGKAGDVVIFPLWPKAGAPAKRAIVRARKGTRGPLTLAAGLVLHAADGVYTPPAEAILRAGAGLDLLPADG
ncbi:MAG: methyltransferase [Rhodospirillales bacterium]|nr:methyltransferase [Rhodospirillales bacterium]